MIVLFTDFGGNDIYVPQMKAALLARDPSTVIIDLLHSVPDFRIEPAAHLLAALHDRFPVDTVFVAVVDPGVGTSRNAAIVRADGRWYVGPDNGLLSVIAARAMSARAWHISWRPPDLSASFHGRDLFAPIAAAIAAGDFPIDKVDQVERLDVALDPGDLAQIIYIDHYGNAMTGLRGSALPADATIGAGASKVAHARVFDEVPAGTAFWYVNSIGLVEIAANRANAAALLALAIGDAVQCVARTQS